MKTSTLHSRLFKPAILATLLTLIATSLPPLRAQQAGMGGPHNTVPARPSGSSGITVHGHWIMDVKDADGRIVEHRDFHNSLTPNGSMTLALALTGQLVYSSFAVLAIDKTSAQPQAYQLYQTGLTNIPTPCPTGGSVNGIPVNCVSGLTATAPQCVIYANPSCTTPAGIVLQGTLLATAPLDVSEVQTSTGVCAATTIAGGSVVLTDGTTSSCGSGTGIPSDVSVYSFPFTDTTIAPLHVQTGQSLLISVAISFS